MWKTLRITAVLATLALGGCLNGGGEGGFVDLSSYERGKLHFNAGQFGLAVKHFQAAVDRKPDSVEALNGLAASYDRLGRYDLSARYYERALGADPDSVQTLNNIGYSYLMQERFDLAVAYLRDAQSRDKKDPVVLANRKAAEVSFQEADLKRSADAARAEPATPPAPAPTRTEVAANAATPEPAQTGKRVKPWIERTAPSVQTLVTQPQVALVDDVEAAGLMPQVAAYRPMQPKAGDLLPDPLAAPVAVDADASLPSGESSSDSVMARAAMLSAQDAEAPLDTEEAASEVTVASLDPLRNLSDGGLGTDAAAPETSETATAIEPATAAFRLSEPNPHEGQAETASETPAAPAHRDVSELAPVEVTVASLDPFHDLTDVGAGDDVRETVATTELVSPEVTMTGLDPLDALEEETAEADRQATPAQVVTAVPEVEVASLGTPVPVARSAETEPTMSVPVDLPLLEVSNGTGRLEMAARFRDYLEAKGIAVDRLTNADHFRHQETTIFFRKGWRAYAEDLARVLPAVIDLDGRDSQDSDVRVELGGDLLEFDRGLYYAGQRSNGANPG